MRVLRVYHAGRDSAHRERERGLGRLGVDLTLVVPSAWPDAGGAAPIDAEPFPILELPVSRLGDVNRHTYASARAVETMIKRVGPDILDIHEEPFSLVSKQWLAAVPSGIPIVMYTAQNVDKRLPPPFAGLECAAHRRVAALYPCSRQAASVARGKGFGGLIDVIPLGFDPALFHPGEQSLDDETLTLALFGRLVPEKGVRDAVRVLAAVNASRPARLVIVGSGPEERFARDLAGALCVADRVQIRAWAPAAEVAVIVRHAHVVLVPSTPTRTWTEQFGRVIVEAQAGGAVVAGYATGSIAEVGSDAAVLVPGGDVDGLASAVLATLDDGGEYARRRALGFALSERRTWSDVSARQARLYERVLNADFKRRVLPASPAARRRAARVEFGKPAETVAGSRPFALPILRRGGIVSASLAALVDAAAELRSRLVGRQRPSTRL